jgi:hypothetical protein
VRCGLIEHVRVVQLATRVTIEEHLIEGEETTMLEGVLLEHLAGACEQCRRTFESKRLCGL